MNSEGIATEKIKSDNTACDHIFLAAGEGDSPQYMARVINWRPIQFECIIYHPETGVIDGLIRNKAEIKDSFGFRYNVLRKFDIMEGLVNRAVYDLMKQYTSKSTRLLNTSLMITASMAILAFTAVPELKKMLYIAGAFLFASFLQTRYGVNAFKAYLKDKESSYDQRKEAYFSYCNKLHNPT